MNLNELKGMSMAEIIEGISRSSPGSSIEKALQAELIRRQINAMLELTETISSFNKDVKELLKSTKD